MKNSKRLETLANDPAALKKLVAEYDDLKQKACDSGGEKNSDYSKEDEVISTSIFASGPITIVRWAGLPDENHFHPVIQVTPNISELIGYSRQEMLDRVIEYGQLVHEDDLNRVLEKIAEHQASGSNAAFTDQYRIRKKDGSVIWISDHTQFIRGEDGTILELVGYLSDVTEHKTKSREAELQRIGRLAAEKADRTKSQFLANMSHEIRTPMNGVMGMAELLAATELTPKQKNFADIIVKSGESLLTIINDILDFSKIDSGEMELHCDSFDFADAVEDVAVLVSSHAAEKNVELIVRFDPKLPPMIVGDAGRLRQVINNLLSNAVKFTQEGHVFVDISQLGGVEQESDKVGIKVSIEDTGIGIPKNKVATIFDKFTQVDNSATRTHEGTGLGLSICKSLIELMGGEIGLESVEGKGSVFWFSVVLPVDKQAERTSSMPVDVCGSRIMIVDDNDVNRTILMEHCQAWGFDSKAVASGEEGIQLLKAAQRLEQPFDTVILDYHMPGINGGQTARSIRDDESISETPIVMLTSVDQKDFDTEVTDLEIQAHLIKPAKTSMLLEAVVQAIQGRGSAAKCESHSIEQVAAQKNAPRKHEFLFGTPDDDEVDILIAEDNDVNQIVYRQILDELDYSYEIVENGVKAVEFNVSRNPRIIIMDVSMPELNGIDATKEIRHLEQENNLSETPVIGVTAHAMSEDMEKCLDAGMNDYLPKPISPKRLAEKIEKWIGQTAKRSSAG